MLDYACLSCLYTLCVYFKFSFKIMLNDSRALQLCSYDKVNVLFCGRKYKQD